MSIRGTDGKMQHIAIPVSTVSGVGHVDIADEPADLGPEATRHHTARRISITRLPSPPDAIIAEGTRQLARVEDKAFGNLEDVRDGRDKTRLEEVTERTIHVGMAAPGKTDRSAVIKSKQRQE